MCGRIALYTPPSRLARFFEAQAAAGLDHGEAEIGERRGRAPSWNVAPSREVLAVVAGPQDQEDRESPAQAHQPPQRQLWVLRWGLVPFWAKDPSIANRLINARAETVATQPAFRRAFARRRCLVAADGFYEWRTMPGPGGRGRRQPWYYHRRDGDPLAFAGLFEIWHHPDRPEEILRTCTIITTDAGPDVAPVHDRMPVVVERGDWDEWLGIDVVPPEALAGLLAPAPLGTLAHHAVDPRMNRPSVDGPEVIHPVQVPEDQEEGQLTLEADPQDPEA